MGAEPQETPIHMNELKQSLLEIEATTESSLPSLDEVEEIIGYQFTNKALLEEAFTHSSYKCSFSLDRLAFNGDAVLTLLFSRELSNLYPDLAPGKLTRLRAANVDAEKLARVALRHGFHRYLRHKKRLLEYQIQEFARGVLDYPLHSNGLIDAPRDLAELTESIVGAIFKDCNSIDSVWEVFKGLLEPIITPETLQVHFNTQLHEMCQKNNRSLNYVDSWEKEKFVDCFIDGKFVGRGTYKYRKEVAQNRAAKAALDNQLEWLVIREKDTAEAQDKESSPSELIFFWLRSLFLVALESYKSIIRRILRC
ncbi:ribonuclease 3-like protein 3 [Argentina anserina]|uniref:ribonuclease 3-like protein 3 n=1 Tax=Argentina anserina TaxID=57926 RepID=UPI002176543A|nr:ribonuclease 3-like protein 3 [Potentilla anserina]